ncbi:hypothetical protein ACWHAM_23115 [Paenibacillus terrae]|uniref:Uncharacterized protein n=1 Tax=Paenibacillus terrae (strain HPL-003) TaxID=985665 RepID=G7VPN2_PAETH|nr:hypothetical protein [Paenibacillus terrae]AET61030.1 hypothetical protein HPL003_21500 [Paenibacillus terrae HPL-003]
MSEVAAGTELTLDSPEALKAIKFLNDLKHTYKIIPEVEVDFYYLVIRSTAQQKQLLHRL